MLRIHCLAAVLLVSLGLASFPAQALGPSVIAIRSGMVLGTLSGGVTTSVSTIPYLDAEYGLFISGRSSLIFRGVIAINLATSDINYAYFGSGQRYYFGSSATSYNRAEGGSSVNVQPKLNYFVGWDAGLGFTAKRSVGNLAVATTAFDSGGTAGLNYFLFDNVSLNTGASISYSLGFSTIAVSGLIMKFFAGVSF